MTNILETALFEKYSPRFSSLVRLPVFRGEETWRVDLAQLHELLKTLKDKDGFDFLVDISSVDHMGQSPRFEMVYELSRFSDAQHLRIKSFVEETGEVPSVTDLWQTANWHEREVYDMMGIEFCGHPDLRRILMWEGYPFFPLRKDFPLEGNATEMPDIAFTRPAPLEGGPFVTTPADLTKDREPHAKPPSIESL